MVNGFTMIYPRVNMAMAGKYSISLGDFLLALDLTNIPFPLMKTEGSSQFFTTPVRSVSALTNKVSYHWAKADTPHTCLVGGLEHLDYFPYIGNNIFQRG